MPIVHIHMIAGRTDDQKRALVAKVTQAVCEAIDSKPEKVRVLLSDMPKNAYAIGGKLVMDSE